VWDGKSDLQLCNGGALVCGNQKGTTDGSTTCVDPDLKSADYSKAGGINRNAAAAESKNPADGIADFVIKVAAIALTLVLYVLSTAGLIVLFFFGIMVLWLLDINPAALNFVDVAQKPWGMLASVGNIMILGAFMYVGFGYMMGIGNMKKNLGDFLLKIIYYAMLLNFTLLGAATIVNVGYGVGNLIKYAYASSTSKADVNKQLMGGIIGPIGAVSYLRCNNGNEKECNFSIQSDADVWGQSAKVEKIGAGIGQLWTDKTTAIAGAISEAVALVMIGFAIYVFWKALYVIFYRIVALWMLMILSPIALASYFSPVDEWKSIGKTMFDKFWKLVLFYPCFIFALVLVNTMSSAFSSAAQTAAGVGSTSGVATTGAAALTGGVQGLSGSTTTPFSIAVFAAGTSDPGASFKSLIVTVLGAAVAMMGLWMVTKYFSDSFEADMGKIGGGIKGAIDAGKTGLSNLGKTFNVAKKGLHIAGAPMRTLGSASKWALKKGGVDVDEIGAKMEKGNVFQRGLAMAGRTTSNLLTGRTLYDLENKAGMAKKLWDGMGNGEKKILAGQKARDDIKNSIALRNLGLGLGGILDDSGSDPARGLSRDVINGKDGKDLINGLIDSEVGKAKSAVVGDTSKLPPDIIEAKLRAMIDPKTGKANINDDIFRDLYGQALEDGNSKVLQMIAMNEDMRTKAQSLYGAGLSDKAEDAVAEKYGAFLPKERISYNVSSKAGNKNYSPSVVEMMDDDFSQQYIAALKEQEKSGEKDATERLNRFIGNRKQQIGNASKRAYDALYKHSDPNLIKQTKENPAYKESDFYDAEAMGGTGNISRKPLGLTHSDYVTAANAIKNNVAPLGASMTEEQYNAAIAAHSELGKIGGAGADQKTRMSALAQAFNVGGKIHAASGATAGLETQKALLEQIAQGATLSANDSVKLGLQEETGFQNMVVKQIMDSYQHASNSDELKKDIEDYRTKNAGTTQREAQQKVLEARKKMAEQSAKIIKQHIAKGLDGGAVDADIQSELSKYMDMSTTEAKKVYGNAKAIAKGGGPLASNIRTAGQTKAAAMQSSGQATQEIERINAQIESIQKEAIKNNGKITP
jgi:hypothetical protein